MNEYFPDKWVIVDYGYSPWAERYAILAGWRGGYLYGDSWRRSSPPISAHEKDGGWVVTTSSGSRYVLSKESIGVTMVTQSLIEQMPVTVIDNVLEISKVFDSLEVID